MVFGFWYSLDFLFYGLGRSARRTLCGRGALWGPGALWGLGCDPKTTKTKECSKKQTNIISATMGPAEALDLIGAHGCLK